MLNQIARFFATAAMLSAVPAIVNAETIAYGTTAPVALSSYVIHESDTSVHNGDGGERPNYLANGLTLDFVNRNDVAATGVTFLLKDGRYTQRIVDKGTFTQGVSIQHTFELNDGLSDPDDAVVTVTDVDFADGGTWHAQVVNTVASAPAVSKNATSAPMRMTNPRATEPDGAERQRIFLHLGTSL